jgi:hypothetical protein
MYQSTLGLRFQFESLDENIHSILDRKLAKIRSDNTEFIDRAIDTA